MVKKMIIGLVTGALLGLGLVAGPHPSATAVAGGPFPVHGCGLCGRGLGNL